MGGMRKGHYFVANACEIPKTGSRDCAAPMCARYVVAQIAKALFCLPAPEAMPQIYVSEAA